MTEMKVLKARMITAVLASAAITSSCTPEQLTVWSSVTGHELDASTRESLIALPDAPGRLPDGRVVHSDGQITGVSAPAGSKCPEHYGAALEAGWSAEDWQRLDHVMWRESRCIPTAHNPRGRDDSYGLIQLNMRAHRSWVGPLVAGDFTRLFDPVTNLRIGRELYIKAVEVYGCGWQPWTTRGARWC